MTSEQQTDRIQEKGTFVKIRYSLQTPEGEYVKGDPREGRAYLEFFTGYAQLLPGLEKKLLGKKAKEEARIRLAPEEAFGPHRPEQVKEKTFREFPQGKELQEGKWVVARDETTHASFGYFVKKKESDRVLLDYNHPLAGKELIYELEILEARPATEEETAQLRPCELGDPPEL
jgi:FKBP-type peptidyl-prolyl cis-trans isomerase SlyD